MKLRQLRRHWNHLAREDSFWAVLTEEEKAGGGWNRDEFFRRGEAEVDGDLGLLLDVGLEPRRETALDFGCGLGRLTQALARHFRRVTGVDISEEMLAAAEGHNRHGDRVTYLHNQHSDLRLIGDGAFDFVYSRITLQHMRPRHMKAYIGEFVRVLAPGGTVCFQVPATLRPGAPWERFKFSWWPPTLLTRIRRYLRYCWHLRFPPVGTMQTFTLSPREVLGCLARRGIADARAIRTSDEGYENYIYVARKAAAGKGDR